MSKSYGLMPIFFSAFVTVFQLTNYCAAQDAVVAVTIRPGERSIAIVEGKFRNENTDRELRLMTQLGSVNDLDKRITGVELSNDGRNRIPHHAVSAGRFIGESDFNSWKYQLDITPSTDRFASAHVTWADRDGALISLQDLLPGRVRSARITINVPEDWRVFSPESSSPNNEFEIIDVDRAVFHAGRELRPVRVRSSTGELSLLLAGEWSFADADAAQMADSIFATYKQLFGGIPARKVQIAIRPFPFSVPKGQWEASARGAGITIMSSDMPFKSQSLQRLHEQLRHEIFHMWIPNGVNLSGSYDWFYEGFGLYNSLKVGLAVNRIRFDDFLDTLSRAHAIASSAADKVSLIKASESRWSGSNTQVYARGMLVAFACDVAMITSSKGKRSISDILKRVFAESQNTGRKDANETILAILGRYKELKPIIERNIAGSESFEWDRLLEGSGLEVVTTDRPTRIKVVENPSGREKDVLDRLGYNNWHKLPRTDK